jgi:putative peptidoglycan lipid II flippase
MVRKALYAVTNKISGLHEAAFWLASFSLASVVLGFLRDRLLAHNFGAGRALDIYYASFEIPDLLFTAIASLVSASILVPLLAKRENGGAADHKKFTDSVFTSFFAVLAIFSGLAWLLMPVLVPLLFGNLGAENYREIITLSRILLLSPFFLGLSNFFGSIVQHERRFVLYSLSPLLYNGGIIAAIIVGAGRFGIKSAIIGVGVGAFLHMALQAVWVFRTRHAPSFVSNINFKYVKETFLLSVPRTIALSASSLVGSVFVVLASKMSPGSIAIFTLGFNLQSVPLSLIGASYSLAAFPTLAEHYVKKEFELLSQCISSGLRYIIFWSLPIIALFIVLRAHIVRVVLGSGQFDWSDTRMTAAVLALFVASIVFQSMQLFLTRTHYALGKTRTPLTMNLIAASFTVLLSFGLYKFLLPQSGFLNYLAGLLKVGDLTERLFVLILPLSFSLGALLAFVLLWRSLLPEVRRPIFPLIVRTGRDAILASIAITVVTLGALRALNNFFELDTLLTVFAHGLLSGTVGLAAGVAVLVLLKNRELREVRARIKGLI